jgi:hypothetical protein
MQRIQWYFLLLLLFPAFLFSQNPKITSQYLIFEYNGPDAREVKLMLSFDDYKTVYYMTQIDQATWQLKLSLADPRFQLAPGRYQYRFIVDNIYIRDPRNPHYQTDPYVGKISYFDISEKLIAFKKTPQKIGPLEYRFYFRNDSGWLKIKEIMFAGNFNSWQPYEYFLKKNGQNIWYIDFKFEKPGTYYYQFVINGEWQRDFANPEKVYNKLGDAYSVVHVEE